MTTPIAADRVHPLQDFHSVILADRAIPADAYYALPHAVNRILAYHNAGINMDDVLENAHKLTRVLTAVPGLTAAALVQPVTTLLQQLVPCRALLRMWLRTHCTVALRLDHLVFVPVPPGHAEGTNDVFRHRVVATCSRSLLKNLLATAWQRPDSAMFSPDILQALCLAITFTRQDMIDELSTLDRLHVYLAGSWPDCYCPDAATVPTVAATGREHIFDYAWLGFLHIYSTMLELMTAHMDDLARAHDIEHVDHERYGDCWEIADYLGLPSGLQPLPDDLDVRPYLDQRQAHAATPSSITNWSTSSRQPTEYEFESVPDSA